MPNYFRGEPIALVANYLDGNSAPITNGISGTTVDFYYYTSSGTKSFYVQSGTMTQDPDISNRYFYIFDVPTNAPVTTHIAQYNAMFSGIQIQSTEYYNIEPQVSSTGIYVGSVAVSGHVVDTSGTGIGSAFVQVTPLNNSSVLTSTTTNISGLYYLYLDPGDFMVIAGAQNYISNSSAYTVPNLVSNFSFGDIVLASSAGTGSIGISDTYDYIDEATQQQLPLVNLKVSLYVQNGATTLTKAIASTRTNSSGTFALTANAGEYVLRIEGNGPNNMVFDTAYDIEVSDAYIGDTPEGFRYKGTSQYGFI